MTAIIVSCLVALLITQFAHWKISLHMVGITGAITTLGLVMGSPFFLLAPFAVIVGWARWRVHAHTLL
jgi:hypothetical protein